MIKKIFRSKTYVCPSWIAFTLDNWFRRRFQDPYRILDRFVKPGFTALDIGCGPGFLTIPMAHLVGQNGRVIAVDIQDKMLHKLRKKANKKGLISIIDIRKCGPDDIAVKEPVDFVLCFWMVHEVDNQERLFEQIRQVMKPDARFLVVEPKLHVTSAQFDRMVGKAESIGLSPVSAAVSMSRAMVFARGG